METLTVRDSLLRPFVTKLKPCVSIATPVRWICSSTYLRKDQVGASENPFQQKIIILLYIFFLFIVQYNNYQLIKELFPAEWLPISITVIFFLGGSNLTPTDSATVINPVSITQYTIAMVKVTISTQLRYSLVLSQHKL